MRIIVGGILQESNTFSTALSTIEDFRRSYYKIDEQLKVVQPENNELKGFNKAASEHGVEVLPTIYTTAVSSGKINRATLSELKNLLYERVERYLPCDGLLLAMHGAWTSEDEDDVTGEMLSELREKVGSATPIVLTLDSHANVTRKMIDNVNGMIGYRTFPHMDFIEVGYKAANLLFDIVTGKRKPHMGFVKIPMIVQAENHQTYRGPMADLWSEAKAGEQKLGRFDTSLFAVQPWLDVKEMGCSVVTVGENAIEAQREAERLAELFWNKRKEFEVDLLRIPQVLELLNNRQSSGPVIISDSADSPSAGSPGDSNYVLRQLLEAGAQTLRTVLLPLVDASAAYSAAAAGIGNTVRLQVGHTISSNVGQPLEIEAVVRFIGDGKFKYGAGFIENQEADMGCNAVVAIGTISLLLMENAVFTGDPQMYRSVGLEPLEHDLVLVKSANQFRAEYEKLSKEIYIVDTPGASTANLRSLSFQHIQRPMYPYDDFDWSWNETT
ncbi:M81 family metallopeptidase [Cohnella silvisoli]|uniref:M81 family metallopeptidase n=1 Tax=Cohnella silvisoli TaxID=2873699 RepID=A0ABV1KWZ7_9BACL|nr:M81 family metallopeptidase [Cohnella silvisoli]MCD9023830.1 M81 family metallopeptidase [Cohnella silvisoli]